MLNATKTAIYYGDSEIFLFLLSCSPTRSRRWGLSVPAHYNKTLTFNHLMVNRRLRLCNVHRRFLFLFKRKYIKYRLKHNEPIKNVPMDFRHK